MIARLAIILMFIASVAAGGLALLNTQTAPIIELNKQREQEKARIEVVSTLSPDSIRFEEVIAADDFTYWKALGDDGTLLGYAALAFGKGYSSTIETVCGFDTEFNVSGLKVTFQQETPGLGTKIVEDAFLGAFDRLSALTAAVVQDRGTVDAVTGATISSRALTNSVRAVALQIKNAVESAPDAVADGDVSFEDIDDSDERSMRNFHDEESGEESGLEAFTDEEAE